MSQQLQITGGAKVRSLEGVITGSTGVLGSLPINASNGIPQLDVNGKILVSQLPNSVMEYKGTWDAATNTPTLADGTGNQGDVYLCNVAGTVNFGSGPISFVVGDQVIYSGTIWQRASGATGSVTSVAVTESGDALSITGSPITTSGTINIGFAGTSAQYVAGDGSLITFPTLTGYVPYTGATANVDLGTFDLTADIVNANDIKALTSAGLDIYSNSGTHIALMGGGGGAGTTFYGGIVGTTGSFASNGGSDTFAINHSSGGGIALNITKGGSGEGLYINKTSGSGNAATIIGTLNATTLVKSGGTSSQFLKADGSVDSSVYALDSLVVKLAGAQTITGVKTFSAQPKFDTAIAIKEGTSGTLTGYTCIGANINQLLIGVVGATHTLTFPTGSSYTYTLPSATGTLALTSDIPSLTGYVTLATNQTITGDKYFTGFTTFNINQVVFGGGIAINNTTSGGAVSGHTVLGANADGLQVNLSGGAYNNLKFANTATGHDYTFPNASGTLALTSDLGSYLPLSGGTLTGQVNFMGYFSIYSDSSNMGALGFNRNASTGAIYNSSYGAYQLQNVNGDFLLSAFNSAGTYQANRLTISSTGAATFSSSVTAGSGISSGYATLNLIDSGIGSARYASIRKNYDSPFDLRIRASNSESAAPITFDVSNAVEAMRITSTGNVGIGVTSPASTLDVRAAIGAGQLVQLANTSGYSNSNTLDIGFALANSNSGLANVASIGVTNPSATANNYGDIYFKTAQASGTLNERMRITSAGDLQLDSAQLNVPKTFLFYANSDTGGSYGNIKWKNVQWDGFTRAEIVVEGDGALSNGRMIFKTGSSGGNATEKMRINSAGAVLVGKTTKSSFTSATTIEVNGELAAYGSYAGVFFENRATAGTMYGWYGNGSGIYLYNQSYGNIGVFGLSTGNYTALSDKNKKKDFEQSEIGLNAVLGLKPTLYRMKSDSNEAAKQLGFIAQEVKDFIPQAYVEQDNFIGLNEMPIIAALVKAIQEQQAQIEELKAKIK